MTQNQRHNSAYPGLDLFPSEAAKASLETSANLERFIRFVLRYPLGLLGGIWLISVLIAILALGGLMDPGVDRSPQTAQSSPSEPSATASPSTSQRRTTAVEPAAPIESDRAIAVAAQSTTAELPGWSLLFLVGACAGGCFVLSRYLQRPTASGTGLVNRKSSRKPPSTKRSTPLVSGPKRLKPFEPNAPQPQPLTAQETLSPQFSATTPPLHTNVAASKSLSTASTGEPTAYEAAAVVTVLPEQADHPLDWPEGSLAHQLDIRQQRSLSSLL
ncbi:hypothetical protein [Almyronema epifaneia]|uniref:Uncharacterized protein n=1 Tax=Almyronema epifaneia S1 TaxID=2991925 RepID=A0ABW6IGS7_9CYAN